MVVLLLALPASAKGKPGALNLGVGPSSIQVSSWIAQQDDWPQPADFIRNSLPGCVWSVDDHRGYHATGYLDPGSVSTQACVVSDFNPVLATRNGITDTWDMAAYGFFGAALSAGLSGSVCYSPQGRCFVFTGTFCGRANYHPDDPALTDIADSHGGRGVITMVTLTVTNPSSRRIRDADVSWGFSSDVLFPAGCVVQPTTGAYPFVNS